MHLSFNVHGGNFWISHFFRPRILQRLGRNSSQHQELDDPSEDISEILADDSSNESSLVSSTGSYEDVSQFGYEIVLL